MNLKFYTQTRRDNPEARLPEWQGDLEKIFARAVDVGECWEWTGAKNEKGYGRIQTHTKALAYTHRVVAAAMGMEIADKQVCHSCDNPSCVRPDHLFVGTNRDNVLDMISKGRWKAPPKSDWADTVRSGNHHWQRFAPDVIREIKARLASGERQYLLLKEYGMSSQHMSQIARGKRGAQI
jgi:hypothetical protein